MMFDTTPAPPERIDEPSSFRLDTKTDTEPLLPKPTLSTQESVPPVIIVQPVAAEEPQSFFPRKHASAPQKVKVTHKKSLIECRKKA